MHPVHGEFLVGETEVPVPLESILLQLLGDLRAREESPEAESVVEAHENDWQSNGHAMGN